jgi:hypothetical protein
MTDLSKYHTKQLLNILNEFRVYNSIKAVYKDKDPRCLYYSSGAYKFEIDELNVLRICLEPDEYPVNESQLRRELAKREHILNKKESKEARREKAKRQRNR